MDRVQIAVAKLGCCQRRDQGGCANDHAICVERDADCVRVQFCCVAAFDAVAF